MAPRYHAITLTDRQLDIVLAAIRATSRSGGGSEAFNCEQAIRKQVALTTNHGQFLVDVEESANRCIDEAVEAGVVRRV